MKSLWKFFSSLKLTVVCLALGLLLVFFGTLAQVDEGLWNAQERWFKSLFIWWGPQGAGWKMPIFPGGYLVGITLLINLVTAHITRFQWGWKKLGIHLTHGGIVLLLVGQLLTDKLSRESLMSLKEGETKVYSESPREDELVFATDAGDGRDEVVSLPGSAVAKQGELTHPKLPFTVKVTKYGANSDIVLRSSVAQASQTLLTALATMEAEYATTESLSVQAERSRESEGREKVWRAALQAVGEDPKGDVVATAQRVATQPEKAGKLLTELKARFRETMLKRFTSMAGRNGPTDDMVAQGRLAERLLRNESILPEAFPAVADNPAAKESVVFDLPATVEMDSRNIAYAVVELLEQGKSLGTWLVSPTLKAVELQAAGKTYRMSYRFERYYQPYSITLLKATHEVYPGTATAQNPQGIPKNFQSRVRIDNPGKSEKREVDIYMNNPLRYAGLTYYQYQMGAAEAASGAHLGTSTFQVVKNPSWLAPYFGCIIVGLGMLWQFGYHLLKFLGKRNAKGQTVPPPPPRSRREREVTTVGTR